MLDPPPAPVRQADDGKSVKPLTSWHTPPPIRGRHPVAFLFARCKAPPRYESIVAAPTPEAEVELSSEEVEFMSSEVRRVGVVVFVAGAALAIGVAGAHRIAAARKRRQRRRWHISGIRVWGARTL